MSDEVAGDEFWDMLEAAQDNVDQTPLMHGLMPMTKSTTNPALVPPPAMETTKMRVYLASSAVLEQQRTWMKKVPGGAFNPKGSELYAISPSTTLPTEPTQMSQSATSKPPTPNGPPVPTINCPSCSH